MKFKYTQLSPIILFLASCAGGGGGSSQQIISPPPAPPGPTYEELKAKYESNYEYQQQWGLGLANASAAYARGSTGKNITIGITDSGLDVSHVEIDGTRVNPNSYLSYSNYTPNTRQKRHGTMVASVAAGILSENSDTPMHGVAFDADIFFVAIQLGEPDDTYEPIDLGDGNGGQPDPDFSGVDNFFENLFKVYTSRNIDIVNNSYGYPGNVIDYSEEIIRNAFPKTIAALAQSGVAPADKTIFVWAAGNAGSYADQGVDYSSPEIFPGMTYLIEEIQGHSIAVVSVDEDGSISDFSSRCGVAAAFCIAAPGGRVIGAYPTSLDDPGIYESTDECVSDNSCYARISGTSFAAPFVSGALAVLFEHFEGQLGSTEIVNRLFATANDEGIYSDSAIYGHGLIDLDAATNPMGSLSVSTSGLFSGEMAPLLTSGLTAYSPILGYSILEGLKSKSIIAFDELNSPFRIPLGSLIASSSNGAKRIDATGVYADPTKKSYSKQGLIFEFINSLPLDNKFNDLKHFSSYSDLNQTLNIIDPLKGTFISFGQNNKISYTAYNSAKDYTSFENPYLDFTKHGVLISQKFTWKETDITWVTSLGQPKITIEEIFHDQNINSQISLILSRKNLPQIQLGWLNEKDTILGLGGSGAFNFSENTVSYYLGMHQSFNLSGSLVSVTGFKSYAADNKFNGALLKNIKDLETSFYNFQILIPGLISNYDLELSVTKPLYISRGSLHLELPIYRDRYLNLYTERSALPLNAINSEMITSLTLRQNKQHESFYLRFENIENPNHGNIFKDYLNVSLGYKYIF